MSKKDMYCTHCKKILNKPFMASPARGLVSPNKIIKLSFCDKKCVDKLNGEAYSFWAELDRNASDSTCFQHDHWESDSLHRKIRVGGCKITGGEVRVEPLQPGDNSGQPKECYEHFELRV